MAAGSSSGEVTLPTQEIINADCMDWLAERAENSITAVVTDPPYGLKEYTDSELAKKRSGKGGACGGTRRASMGISGTRCPASR